MLELCTGCRLHFGLMELAAGAPHRFGGLGLMVQMPQVRVRVGPKQALDACRTDDVEISARVQAAAQHAQQQQLEHPLRSDWTVAAVEHPRLHSGLGLGTQLAAAVAATTELGSTALGAESDPLGTVSWHTYASTRQPADALPASSAARSNFQASQVRALARLSGRGKRSAVGLHGFLYGGLVQDFGQSGTEAEPQAPRERAFGTRSCAFPGDWPIVLILSTEGGDMCGAAEEDLIGRAGSAPNSQRALMLELGDVCMAAAAAGEFQRFADALEHYMEIAAKLFAPVQAGCYRDGRIAARVELAQAAGLRGVGQSSWGPTVFGFAQTDAQALQAVEELRVRLKGEPVAIVVTHAANQGASWRQIATGVQHAS